MKFHSLLAKAVAGQGGDTLFGLMGDANLYFAESFVREYGGRFLPAVHEGNALLMASGYASTSGRLGVATVTHGPGLTNAMTALVEGVRSRTPLLLVVGDTACGDRDNIQGIEQRDVIIAAGAGFEQVAKPSTVVDDVARAIRRASVEHRPIALNVPVDYQWTDVADATRPRAEALHQDIAPDPDAVDRALGIIASARRPIVLAGRGAIGAAGRNALVELAERIGAPLATTLRAKDLFRDEPYNIGIFGTLSSGMAADVIAESDCIVAFGASLNYLTASRGAFFRGRRVIQCDIDPAKIGHLTPVDAGVVGSVAEVAKTMVRWLDEAEVPPSDFRSAALARRIANFSPLDEFDDLSTKDTLDIRTALIGIDRMVGSDRVLVTDGGRFAFEAWKLISVRDPRSFVFTINFGSIGLGMGSAIGAAVGSPGSPVLLVTGDGGFMMSGLTEFHTAVRNGIDLIVVICNDGSYGAEHVQFRSRGMDPSISTFEWPDFASVANALGGQGVTIRNLGDLERLAPIIELRDRPVLIDIKLDPDKVPGAVH